MKLLSFLSLAQSDIQQIWYYTAKNWSINQADNYINDIMNVCKKLASGDLRGKEIELKKKYFKYRVASHVVYFSDSETKIKIVRVLHGSMDIHRHLQ